MKILILTSRFPYPLEKGDKLRIYYQIRELAARGHEIVLVALNEYPVHDIDFQQVSQFCKSIHVYNLSKIRILTQILGDILRGGKLPFQVSYFYNLRIKKQIQKRIDTEKPDHIYCHLARMAPYVSDVNLPKTLDYMDAFGAGSERRHAVAHWLLRPFWRIETRRMLDFERFLFKKFDHTTIIAAQDRAWLPLSREQQNAVVVVPNGVDTQYFMRKNGSNTEGGVFQVSDDEKLGKLSKFPQLEIQKYGGDSESPQYDATDTAATLYDLCFVGNLGYYSNVAAVEFLVKNILPILKKHKPDIKILLAGARPSAEVQRLADENVIVKGWFNDIREAYAVSKIMVAPLMHGTGQQNKILEAMSMSVPVITTTRVNNAIGAAAESQIFLADTEGVFSEQILRLLDDAELRKNTANAARDFVVEQYSWAASVATLEKTF